MANPGITWRIQNPIDIEDAVNQANVIFDQISTMLAFYIHPIGSLVWLTSDPSGIFGYGTWSRNYGMDVGVYLCWARTG